MALVDFNALALAPCIGTFGDGVIYQPGAGPGVPLTGIFNAYATDQKIDGLSGEMRQVSMPTLALNMTVFPAGMPPPVRGESVVAAGVLYEIVETTADHFGHLLLKLMRASG